MIDNFHKELSTSGKQNEPGAVAIWKVRKGSRPAQANSS
jgi:hypothetical protein